MGIAATLAGHRVTSGQVQLPSWGRWWADVHVDGEVALTGAVVLQVADLTLKGTVLAGGPDKGRSHFRVVAGAGGWGKELPAKSYQTDAGVRLANVLTDAARAAGETIDITDTRRVVGPHWTRPEGAASHVLELVSPREWYVGEDGVTRLGRRPTKPLAVPATHGPVDRARRKVTIAADAIATIFPGVVVDGLEAVDVLHEISAEGGLRSTIWGKGTSPTSRVLAWFVAMLEQLDPGRLFRGVTEYRIVAQRGERFDLQPVFVSGGMPDLQRVPIRPGIAGHKAQHKPGARVLVGFVNSDPGRPYVAGVEDPEGSGFLPLLLTIDAETLIKLGQGLLPVARAADLAGGIWPIVPTQTKVLV